MTAAHLAQRQVTVILPDKIRVQKTVTSIFQDVWVPGTPTEHRPHNFLGTRLWHMGHWMHAFLFILFFFLNLPDRQTQTNARRHKANRRKTGEENKWERRRGGGKNGGGKNNLSSSLLPAPPRWPCLWFPACACCRPAIPPLSRSSPEKKKKRNGTKGGVRMPAKKSTLCECGRGIASPFPVHAFSRIMHLLHMRYTLGWMNYKVSKWITHERCHLYADLWAVWGGVCTLTLNCISS